jgi:hypothetical protein
VDGRAARRSAQGCREAHLRALQVVGRVKAALEEFEQALDDHAEAIRDLEAGLRRTGEEPTPPEVERALRARLRRLHTVHRRFLNGYQAFLGSMPSRVMRPPATAGRQSGAIQTAT